MRKLMVAFAFLLSSAAGATESLRLPVPELETLPNGLEVAWFLNDRLPVVDLALLVKSGSRDDPQGRSGTAELLSSCLDRGAGGLSARELAAAVERLGASRYISADEDTFSVGMHGLAPDAPVLLDILARLVVRPEFPEAEVAREHARLQDRWSHLADYSESLAGVAFRRLMTAGTSYGRGSFLSAAEFSKVGRAEIAAFHRRHFTPRNSILMVVGRVDRTEFRRRILDSFGEWKGEAPVRERKKYFDPRLPRSPAGKIVIVDRPGLTQAQVRLGLPAPLIQAPEHYALVVANAMLGEYFHSRLNTLIRDKLGLTYGIGSGFSYSKDLASFGISSATRNEAVGKLVRESVRVLRELKSGPIPEEEVATAKEYLVGGFPLSTATLSAVAARWLGGTIFGLGPEYLNEFIPRVGAVKASDVSAAVAKDFDLSQLVIVIAGDAKEIRKGLAGYPSREVIRLGVKDLL